MILMSNILYSQEIDVSVIDNLSEEQITIAKDLLNEDSSPIPIKDTSDETKDAESLKNNEKIKESAIDSSKYGYRFISTSPTSIIATGDLPLPNDYKISIGDTFTVILSGSMERIFDLKVQLNGEILFPELGSIYVVGETFGEVKKKLRNLIDQSYIGVRVDLSLKNLSAKKITIVGTVNSPGTYLVNPFTTISNALAYSGGINDIGSLRNIKLIRSTGEEFIFDLYALLIDGDRSSDITIESGDVIMVSAAKKFIEISGEVNRPAIYELLPGENLSDLLKFALGIKGSANTSKITLTKLDVNTSSINKVMTSNLSEQLDGVLSVNIYPLRNKIVSKIYVGGAVKEPGYYDLNEDTTLEEFIERLEFINVYPWLAVLEQFDENNLIKSTTLFNLKDPNTYKTIELMPNSKLFFADLNLREYSIDNMTRELKNDYSLRINHKQGSFNLPIYGKFSLKSFINLLGLDMSDVNKEATYISPLESKVIVQNYDEMEFTAKKYNTISFRSPVNNLIRVSISGEIEYPGTYTLESDATLEDLYSLVGSFKKEAYTDAIVFTRASIRERQLKSIAKSRQDLNEAILVSTQRGENIGDIDIIRALSETIDPENLGRIAGDYSPKSIAAVKTVLFNGDKIIIPKNPNVITVLGEVLNPIAFEYKKGLSVRDTIEYSGGYKEFADKGSVYVIKANGLIERPTRNIFTKSVTLEPGDTIIVPRKIITNNPGIESLIPITRILSDLAFSAAAIESLSNNK